MWPVHRSAEIAPVPGIRNMYSINQSHGCKPLTCDHLYGTKYGTKGILLHVVRPQWHPCPRSQQKVLAQDYWARWPRSCPRGQDLAQDLAQDLRQDPGSQSWYLGQDLGQVLGKISCPRTFCWKLINCAPRMASFPRCAPTMASLSMLCAHNGNASLCAHNGCPRCAPTMAVHVVRPQWLPTLCAHNGAHVHVVRGALVMLCASLAHPSL